MWRIPLSVSLKLVSRESLGVPSLRISIVALGLILSLAACASSVSFRSAQFSPIVTVSGSLYRPEGAGPFPAMVLLHTCAGLGPHVFGWAAWLKAEGYVALVVDSFSPRARSKNVCGVGSNPSVYDVTSDALGALAYLRSLPFVDRDRVGVMGWSYGGKAALQASNSVAQPPGGGFRVSVAFYASCDPYFASPVIPVLLLLAEADDSTPSAPCVAAAERFHQMGRTVVWTVYPGAHHGFDKAELGTTTVGKGYTMKYDAAATADAAKRIRAFLAQYLRRAP